MWLVCRIRGWGYTYIVYDLYPDYLAELEYIKTGGVIDRVWGTLQRRAFLAAKHVVALGPRMKERISTNAGPTFDTAKIRIIHNWEDPEFIEPMDKSENWFSQEHDLVDPFSILYSGNIGDFHDLETLIEAAAHLREEDAKFLIIGEGDNKETIVSLADELGVKGDSVAFLPYQPWDDLPYSLTSADISVVTVREETEGICVSSKLYTAMAAGTPVLIIAQPSDDEAQIVEQFDAGLQATPGNPDEVVTAIETWMANPELVEVQGENARNAFESHFTKNKSVEKYYEMLVN
jgi:glycosyltransferase involved in cell wall biosynthesis